MKRRLKYLLTTVFAAVMVLTETGCSFFSSVEDLMTLPTLPIEYTELSEQINEMLNSGYEYASPTSGKNIQAVQMIDLDNDGKQEALAFLRNADDVKPLKIVIFSQENDTYFPLCTIESSGTSIESVSYQDFTKDGTDEIVVGWKMSNDVLTLAVYEIGSNPETLLSSGYTKFTIADLNDDGYSNLVLFRTNSEGAPIAELYSWENDSLVVSCQCNLSNTMADLNRGSIVSGYCTGEKPAIFATGVNEDNIAITDILCCRDETNLVNLAADPDTGLSQVIFKYSQLKPQDINRDGYIEIPSPQSNQQTNNFFTWIQYNQDGIGTTVERTYHCNSEGWYFVIPNDWTDPLEVLTDDSDNESQTILSAGGDAMVAIYSVTGENRTAQASRDGRIPLKVQTETIYSGKILSKTIADEASEELLRQSFNMIVADWVISR